MANLWYFISTLTMLETSVRNFKLYVTAFHSCISSLSLRLTFYGHCRFCAWCSQMTAWRTSSSPVQSINTHWILHSVNSVELLPSLPRLVVISSSSSCGATFTQYLCIYFLYEIYGSIAKSWLVREHSNRRLMRWEWIMQIRKEANWIANRTLTKNTKKPCRLG